MSSQSYRIIACVLLIVGVLLGGCQAIQPSGANSQSAAWIEQMKAEAVKHELGTFDLYINRDWKTLDAETDPNFYQIGPDGAYIERAAALAGIADEKLVVRKPDLGEIRVEMITPDAYMVTYPLNFNGSYDGADFSNPRTVGSLWVNREGKWQNIFLVEQIRTVEFTPVAGN
ncbi:MAG: nuclear transport factor 2 family protein [Anaerolineae bacterium]|uniref:nuclear transport factor 2 family protein n=1 Tax=Candidatus Amarolinea dominans TaxID=3140696 RepID=UPI001D849C02|nr:nuclear transport factor 2 family protein [Anaerolineae bacterium]MBK9232235.1 nuclear transport factor 2 family protein [Anaerolineae bacterium]